MSKRAKKSLLKIKSSDGEEFEIDDEIVQEMETLKSMTMLDDDDKEIPTCAVDGRSLKKVLVWTAFQYYFKNKDLKEDFNTIITADYLANEGLTEEILKKVFLENSKEVIFEAAKNFEDATITSLLEGFKRRNEVLVMCHDDKIKYFDPQKHQWITTVSKIPYKVSYYGDVCATQDKIFFIGTNDNDYTKVSEYNPRTNSWRSLTSASFSPVRKGRYSENSFSVDTAWAAGNKLYIRSSIQLHG